MGATMGYRGVVKAPVVVQAAKIDVGRPDEGREMASGRGRGLHMCGEAAKNVDRAQGSGK